MPSTAETLLHLELMATGENDDTWGDKTNVNLQLIANAIAKRLALTLSNVNVTLTDTNFADNQARSACLGLTGTLTGNVEIICPSRSKLYLVQNGCTGAFTVTLKTAAGTGVVCPQGATLFTYCDGTNVVAVRAEASDADTLDGLQGNEYARLAFFNQFTSGNAYSFHTVTDGAVITVDGDAGNNFIVTLGGNRVVVLDNPHDGQPVELWIVQDGTGSRTLTWPANVQFEGGTPTLSTAPGSIDRVQMTYNLAEDLWIARFSQTNTSTVINTTLSGNEIGPVSVFQRVGSPGGVITLNFITDPGVVIEAPDTQTPALDFRGFASGSTINWVNRGYVLGHGGDGGDGAGAADPGTGAFRKGGLPGRDGGTAVIGPGAGITFNIVNAEGFIWGGGGGGGGGAASSDSGATPNHGNGGGGGGGAGGGRGGRTAQVTGSNTSTPLAELGDDGGNGPNGTQGAGGAGAATADASGGAGGAGGDWGDDGTAGTASATENQTAAAGTFGAAGLAIDQNGGTATFVSGGSSPNVEGAVT